MCVICASDAGQTPFQPPVKDLPNPRALHVRYVICACVYSKYAFDGWYPS